ncbi:hypothetical protein PAPHI01_0851 [Pancytospora philotis]|nr:hypothetical protein PAPHI01_0851 [Pancytospora philotis]
MLILLAFLTRCISATSAADSNKCKFTSLDYANFGAVKPRDVGSLEEYVLNHLYKRCTMHSCPEIPSAVIDNILPHACVGDKARLVMLTVLGKPGWCRMPIEKLAAEAGFGGIKLLSKLLDAKYVTFLKQRCEEPQNPDLYLAFNEAVTGSQTNLYAVRGYIRTTLSHMLSLGLALIVEVNSARNNCIDLIIYIYQLMIVHKAPLAALFSELVRIWTSDYVRDNNLVPVIRDALRIALDPNTFDRSAQNELKKQILSLAICTCEREYFDFYSDYYGVKETANQVVESLRTNDRGDMNLPFILKYINHIEDTYEQPRLGLVRFFDRYLPPPFEFHTTDSVWNREPEYFNRIPYLWLRSLFTRLHSEHAWAPTRDVFMRRCMRIMKYSTLINITKYHKVRNSCNLTAFMLQYLDEETREAYKRSLYMDIRVQTDDIYLKLARQRVATALNLPRYMIEAIKMPTRGHK